MQAQITWPGSRHITYDVISKTQMSSSLGAIHKPCGQIFGHFFVHVDKPLIPPSLHVDKHGFFGNPLPSPALSTWFMDDPLVYEFMDIHSV